MDDEGATTSAAPPHSFSHLGYVAARRYIRSQHWQPMAKYALRSEAGKRQTPKNYLGLYWQTMQPGRRERAAYQMLSRD
jgi:hypothetical protein